MRYAHDMPFGAALQPDGSTRFRLWAPSVARIDIELLGPRVRARAAMAPAGRGWFEHVVPDAGAGTRYRYILESGLGVPDPASRCNPLDVHGPSEVVDPLAYPWREPGWSGRPWEEAVVYELHVGTFTPEGTFDAAATRLSALVALGVTAVELMPVAEFPGHRNWGYDGVLPFAPDATYGSPASLKALVDHAHSLGLMMILDVVYNHFGPEGNYLHAYAAPFFDASRHTPWGSAIAFDDPQAPEVRSFFVNNALYWVEEYRFDGLRLDAVHAIEDRTDPDIVREIATALREGPGRSREIHLILENDRNEPALLARDDGGRPLAGTAQWNDDLHHAAHVLVTGERDGYYADYAQDALADLGRALAEGFVFQGQASPFRGGQARGGPTTTLPPCAFISFLQTHDQVGNRALGDRMHGCADTRLEATALACLLLSPHVPMLFMGEEWAASTPFLYFCDFAPDLARAVTEGRRREFAGFAAFASGQGGGATAGPDDPEARAAGAVSGAAQVPDPAHAMTFEASKLDWTERAHGQHRVRLEQVAALLAVRREALVPKLPGTAGCGRCTVAGRMLQVEWLLGDGTTWRIVANFGDQCQTVAPDAAIEVYSEGVSPATSSEQPRAHALRFVAGAVRVTAMAPDASGSRGSGIGAAIGSGLGSAAATDESAPAVVAPPARVAAGPKVPRATYRLQFNESFTFDDAVRIVPYLARLGVSHVYSSPILRARPGSRHGYDIVAHDEINPELGGRPGFDRLCAALRLHGMGQVVDIVPNHMGVLGADNAWWMEVLEHGAASRHARFFDIDWHPVDPMLDGKVLLPVLGGHYGDVLASGQLQIAFDAAEGMYSLHYHGHRLPLDPLSYPALIQGALDAMPAGDPDRALLATLLSGFQRLPGRWVAADSPEASARQRDSTGLKAKLGQLACRSSGLAEALDAAAAAFCVQQSTGALHALLETQAWRLAYWRVASDDINYRRFFDVNELAALRMEDPLVFDATHALVLDLAAGGMIDGLRIDHPDGLSDPARYFWQLQQGHAKRAGLPAVRGPGRTRPHCPLYVVIEKITAAHERVPETWHVHGTTGYRYAMVVNGVMVDSTARRRIDRIWRAFTGVQEGFAEVAYQGRRAIMRSSLASELTRLSTRLLRIARADPRTRDYTLNTLRQALAEVAACMPVYRTYITRSASRGDQRYIDWAIAHARRRSRNADPSIFDFVRQSICGEAVHGAPATLRERVLHFAMHFQQFTSPVTAKGVEDTAFYRYSRLVSLNEVGGDPEVFGLTVRAFHGASADRAANWPATLIATSTHDNKRSEDVRNRINVLSEMPAGWRLALRRWKMLNRSHRTKAGDLSAPSPRDEYLLYQTLLGTLPVEPLDDAALGQWRARIEANVLKAAREAKLDTSWIAPDATYEDALRTFVRGLLGRLHPNPFLDDLRMQAATVARFGALNSIATTVLKYTSPGVPDLYQGNELIDLSLVDPDNRRPVDYARRVRLLDELAAIARDADSIFPAAASLMAHPEDGRAKLWATWRLLQLRQSRPALFAEGAYAALAASGEAAGHVIAFQRNRGDETLVTVSGRLFAKLAERRPASDGSDASARLGGWGDTCVQVPVLPPGQVLTDVLTGRSFDTSSGTLPLAALLCAFPATALLAANGTASDDGDEPSDSPGSVSDRAAG